MISSGAIPLKKLPSPLTFNNQSYIDLNFKHDQKGNETSEVQLGSTISCRLAENNFLRLQLEASKLGDGERGPLTAKLNWETLFNLPVSRKQNIGIIRGKIYVAEVQEKTGIKDVIVRISDKVVVTDKKGRFVFYGLPVGKHYLFVDNISSGKITNVKNPLEVILHNGEEKDIEIGIIRGSFPHS